MTSVFRQLAEFTKNSTKVLFKTRNGSSANCAITKNKDLTSCKHRAPYFFCVRFSYEQRYVYIQAHSQCCVRIALQAHVNTLFTLLGNCTRCWLRPAHQFRQVAWLQNLRAETATSLFHVLCIQLGCLCAMYESGL